MTFQEKNALTTTAVLVVVFGGHFTLVVGEIAETPNRDLAYTGLLVGVAAVLTILATTSHVVLALLFRSQANAYDERDRLIGLRSGQIAGYVLALGVCTGIGLAISQVDAFWIAQALIGSLVAAEVIEGIVKVVLYRRSA